MLKTCKRINCPCTCRPANGCQCSHPRQAKATRNADWFPRHVPFPTFPHTTESGTVTAEVSHHEAKSAVILWTSENLINRTRLVASKKG